MAFETRTLHGMNHFASVNSFRRLLIIRVWTKVLPTGMSLEDNVC